ncbi:hypothetical protein GIB67_040258, partial [Kingdonia uniflora]
RSKQAKTFRISQTILQPSISQIVQNLCSSSIDYNSIQSRLIITLLDLQVSLIVANPKSLF